MTFLDAIRNSYDTVAAGYATSSTDSLSREPVLRSMLTLFAELTLGGRVADVGSGPGHVTTFLREQGLDVYGVDLSPAMVEQARAAHPEVSFEVGSMTALGAADGSLAGLNAWFSTIHIPAPEFPAVLAEFHRVLSPGAPLMLAFQVGDGPQQFTEAWGHPVDLILHRRRPEAVATLLTETGFHLLSTTVLERTSLTPRRQWAFVIARKPE